jgi:hypothetical protein
MADVRRLVVDILKPHEPDTVEVAAAVADCQGVAGVNAGLLETDKEVQNVKLTVEGASIPVERVHETIADLGATVHSTDEVVCGETIVEASHTPQD